MSLHRTGMKFCLLAACFLSGRADRPAVAFANSAVQSTVLAATYYPEIRLRKVHLVRPDLIFYPLDYEVFC